MKRIFFAAAAAATFALAAPMPANAADLGHGYGVKRHHHSYSDKCHRRFDRCTKLFSWKGVYCEARLQRCEMRMAHKYHKYHHKHEKRAMKW